MHAAPAERRFQRRHEVLGRRHPRALGAVALGVFDEIRVAEGEAPIREAVDRLLPADHAVGGILEDQHHEVEPEADRRLHLLRVHHEAAVAADREHAPVRVEQLRHHGRGQAGAHGRERVVEEERVGDVGAVVAREPDLVHAVVERDDAVARDHLADVVDDALRRRREALLVGAVDKAGEDLLAQRQQRLGVLDLALDPAGEELEARSDVADDLGMGEVDLLDVRRRVADMDHLRPLRAHDEGRLLDRVVPDGDDEVGLVDRLVDVVPLREGGGADVELRAAGDRALAHLRREERNLGCAARNRRARPSSAAGSPPRRA